MSGQAAANPAAANCESLCRSLGKLVAEKTARSNYKVRLAEPLDDEIAQAGAHGITDQQRAGEHSDGSGHAKHDGEIGAPVVEQTSFEKLESSHYEFQIPDFKFQISKAQSSKLKARSSKLKAQSSKHEVQNSDLNFQMIAVAGPSIHNEREIARQVRRCESRRSESFPVAACSSSKQGSDDFRRLVIEIAGGFVTQQQLRFHDQCARERDALLFAAGKLRRPVVEAISRDRPVRASSRARLQALASAADTSVGVSTFSSTEHCGSRQWS